MSGPGLANDTFKRSYQNMMAGGIIAAVLAHFILFALFPKMEANRLDAAAAALEAIELPPEVQIPPPPEHVARPATPKVAVADIAEDVTIAPTTFESNPVENLPPPPRTGSPADRPSFIPYTQAPRLNNRTEVASFLNRSYPMSLQEAKIEGSVILWIYIDELGRVQRTVLSESSGYTQLDEAAMKVAEIMEFRPAFNRDKKTPVWISQPMHFALHNRSP